MAIFSTVSAPDPRGRRSWKEYDSAVEEGYDDQRRHVEVERSDSGDVGIDVPADQPEEVIQVHAPVLRDDLSRYGSMAFVNQT